MDLLLRKLALRNAAKVAFGSSLVMGCGGTITDGNDAATTADANGKKDSQGATDSSVLDVAQPIEASSDAPLACTGPVDIDAGDPGSTVFQCCLPVIEAITGDAGFVVVDAGEVTGDPSIDNCCKAVIAHVDNFTQDYSAADQVLSSCCNALGYPVGPACTPWGPPTPPEMKIEMEIA